MNILSRYFFNITFYNTNNIQTLATLFVELDTFNVLFYIFIFLSYLYRVQLPKIVYELFLTNIYNVSKLIVFGSLSDKTDKLRNIILV